MKEQGMRQRVAEAGINGEAKIVARKSSALFYVTFAFDVLVNGEAQSYQHEQQVSRKKYHALVEGTVVPIRYLTTDPEHSAQLTGMYADSSFLVNLLAYGGLSLIMGIAIAWVILGGWSDNAHKASATATSLAAVSGDLGVIRAALEPLIVEWKRNGDQEIHTITAAEAGLSGVMQEDIVYGYCEDGTFYVYAPKGFQMGRNAGIRTSDAYSYNSKADVYCLPNGWIMAKKGDLGNGWFFANVAVIEATATLLSE